MTPITAILYDVYPPMYGDGARSVIRGRYTFKPWQSQADARAWMFYKHLSMTDLYCTLMRNGKVIEELYGPHARRDYYDGHFPKIVGMLIGHIPQVLGDLCCR